MECWIPMPDSRGFWMAVVLGTPQTALQSANSLLAAQSANALGNGGNEGSGSATDRSSREALTAPHPGGLTAPHPGATPLPPHTRALAIRRIPKPPPYPPPPTMSELQVRVQRMVRERPPKGHHKSRHVCVRSTPEPFRSRNRRRLSAPTIDTGIAQRGRSLRSGKKTETTSSTAHRK